ncbi:MAG: hypothetical protein HYR55_20300 [Acidobacteria bacterium]|nr:hypothetical protein [Acidobacteriota bacterium]MBI3656367.1 hypothetical protein [Acidobacteriota bacterium]
MIRERQIGVVILHGLIAIALMTCMRSSALAQDPGAVGPYAVTLQEYDLGNGTISGPRVGGGTLTGPVELKGSVHAPTNLAGGPFPVVMILHGRHVTCSAGSSIFMQWPCSPGRTPIWSYRGYNYLAQTLASNGYIVISVSANGINAIDNGWVDAGAGERAALLHYHLDRWNEFNTVGGPAPIGSRYIGAVDLTNVGLVGHSRGGEGVVSEYNRNASLGYPYGINAVFGLAPTNFQPQQRDVTGVAFGTLLPYCDGDVYNLQGELYYDVARYRMAGDPGDKSHVLVMGANHNFYNTVWTPPTVGGADDWTAFRDTTASDPYCARNRPSGGRLTAAEQRATGLAYISAFFRFYLGFEDFFTIITGDSSPPPSAGTATIYNAYHPLDDPSARLTVNRFTSPSNLTINTLGGSAGHSGLSVFAICQAGTSPGGCGTTQYDSMLQLRTAWNSTAAQYRTTIPTAYRDVSLYNTLSFRAGVVFNDARNPTGQPRDISVVLVDGNGNVASARTSDYSPTLYFPPGGTLARKVVMNSLRVPLWAYSGVDLTNIQTIRIDYDQNPSGHLFITDLMFTW